MTDSIFTKIIKGEIPCHKIEENEHFIAFLDIMPLKKGHTLVVPKVQVDYIFDLENQTLGELMIFFELPQLTRLFHTWGSSWLVGIIIILYNTLQYEQS